MKQFCTIIASAVAIFLLNSFVFEGNPEGLKKGEKAPVFATKETSGSVFDLKKKLSEGPVVVVFYRGQWCPYCNKYLSELQDSLKMIQAKGATLVAVSPETQASAEKTMEKTKASFPIIHDDGLKISNLYKVNYTLDEKAQETYKGYGINFESSNGMNGANLPVPATYVIGKDGMIKYVFFNPDITKRASVKEILKYL